jgi:hypothetical protein
MISTSSIARAGATLAVASALIVAAPLAAHAETLIDTYPVVAGDGSDYYDFGPVDSGATSTYGQTITVPVTDTTLAQWQFEVKGANDFSFRGQVYAWDNATRLPVGDALFTSEPQMLTTTAPNIYQTVTVSTGGLQLTAGASYVLLLTTLLDPQTSTGDSGWLAVSDSYAGGYAAYSNENTVEEMLANWDGIDTSTDFAIRAQFGSVATTSSITPTSGAASGGSTVVLTGQNFTGATQVLFGSVPATGFTVDSATQITAVTPAQAAGVVDVTVVTPFGTSAVVAAGSYTYVAAAVAAPAPAAAPQLAATGASLEAPAALALALLLAGAGVLIARRRSAQ